CQICKKSKSPHNGMVAELIRPSLFAFIKQRVPDVDSKTFICFEDLDNFRKDYVTEILKEEVGELSALDHEDIQSLEQHEILSADVSKQFDKHLTFGEGLSDRIADFGGSWKFIIAFAAVLVGWIVLNGIFLFNRGFDPYPFILLNLILSCLAAIQAPIIMMSQNRAEARDRLRAENDYKVNLKAIGDPSPPRKNRPPLAKAIQPLVRDPANPDRTPGRNQSEAQAVILRFDQWFGSRQPISSTRTALSVLIVYVQTLKKWLSWFDLERHTAERIDHR